jgi:hypothetical protein
MCRKTAQQWTPKSRQHENRGKNETRFLRQNNIKHTTHEKNITHTQHMGYSRRGYKSLSRISLRQYFFWICYWSSLLWVWVSDLRGSRTLTKV